MNYRRTSEHCGRFLRELPEGAAPRKCGLRMSYARWEHFPHDADIGVRGFGTTPAEAFEQAALALTAVVTQAEVRPLAIVAVTCEAPDHRTLVRRLAQHDHLRDGGAEYAVRPLRRNDRGEPAASNAVG